MARHIVTANRLGDGRVVYFTAGDAWSAWPDEAAVAAGNEAANVLLTRAQVDAATRVVEPYLVEIEEGDAITPRRRRERIRALGPTVRRDLGKQAARRSANQRG